MSCTPEENEVLEGLVLRIKEKLLDSQLLNGTDLLKLISSLDANQGLKISVEISIPEKIQESQFQYIDDCVVWNPNTKRYEPC